MPGDFRPRVPVKIGGNLPYLFFDVSFFNQITERTLSLCPWEMNGLWINDDI